MVQSVIAISLHLATASVAALRSIQAIIMRKTQHGLWFMNSTRTAEEAAFENVELDRNRSGKQIFQCAHCTRILPIIQWTVCCVRAILPVAEAQRNGKYTIARERERDAEKRKRKEKKTGELKKCARVHCMHWQLIWFIGRQSGRSLLIHTIYWFLSKLLSIYSHIRLSLVVWVVPVPVWECDNAGIANTNHCLPSANANDDIISVVDWLFLHEHLRRHVLTELHIFDFDYTIRNRHH